MLVAVAATTGAAGVVAVLVPQLFLLSLLFLFLPVHWL